MKAKSQRKNLCLVVLSLATIVAGVGCNGAGLVGLQAQSSVNLDEFARDFARQALAAFLL